MRKTVLIPISILVAFGTAYTAESAENPATTATPAAPVATPAASVVPVAAVATPAAAAINLSGKWSSNLIGDVTIEQKDNKITGTYQYTEDGVTLDGRIEGLIKDKLIQAKWWARPKVGSGEESRGDLEWKIADDGKMLVGWYREEGEKEKYDLNLQQ